jgi:hypothetical protein
MLKHITLAIAVAVLSRPGWVAAQDWTPLLKDDALRDWRSAGAGESFRLKADTLTLEGVGQLMYGRDDKPVTVRDFELRAEVLTRPGGRAGLAFHLNPDDPRASGGLEVRLDNSYGPPSPGQSLLKTGSLVWLRPVVKSVVPDDRWFPVRVAVQAPRVQVWVADQLVVDYVEPEVTEVGPRLKQGALAVRGHGGTVLLRKLELKRLTGAAPGVTPVKLDATGLRVSHLLGQGFSLVDFHTHLKGGLTLDDVLARSRQTGVGAGVAVNCGKGFAVTDDKGAEAFLKAVGGRPVFVGMQAEGREWVRLFSPATVARFDYVFTDAMTLTDTRGRRTRLWIKEEVDIPDPQAFMDLLVKTIEEILEREPIDFYANPTYLPEVLARDYERLWTPARLRRVVDALARSGVALEINDRLKLPRPGLIKMAKAAGVKFTFGTNNADRTPGRLEYCLRMIEECALTPDDLWSPRPDGQKPIQVRKRR